MGMCFSRKFLFYTNYNYLLIYSEITGKIETLHRIYITHETVYMFRGFFDKI